MVVVYFGDIFGKPGRKAVSTVISDIKSQYQPDFLIANVENLAGGRGVNRKTLQEMIDMGFQGFTSGNHIWDNKEVYSLFEAKYPLIRPANLPPEDCPGQGYMLLETPNASLYVINVMGRIFMDQIDCPFRKVSDILPTLNKNIPILVDMHADATSEKYAMGWHLAGRVSAMVGSHSHVQTADERILPGGTAYITDVGMTGAFDSVIGLRPTEVIRRFMTKRPHPVQNAIENLGVGYVVIDINLEGKATSIQRFRYSLNGLKLEIEKEKDTE